MKMKLRTALLGASLAIPAAVFASTAFAEPPDGSRTIVVPPGATVLILPGPGAVPPSPEMTATAAPAGQDPFLQLVAEQDAMMRTMMADMNTAFAQPAWPAQLDSMIQAALRGGMPGGTGAGMVFTSMSAGPGSCSERVTYAYPARGGKPQVTVSRSGNACGALAPNAPLGVAQPVPAPAPRMPEASPAEPRRAPHLWSVSYPAHATHAAPDPRS